MSAALLFPVLALAALPQVPGEVRLEPEPTHLAILDLDGDGGADLVRVRKGALAWSGADGVEREIPLPGEAGLWSVVDLDGDGRDEFATLVDGESLQVLAVGEDGVFAWQVVVPELGAGGLLPRGHRPCELMRDVDGDGRADLIVPMADRVRLWFGGADGLVAGPELRTSSALGLAVDRRPGRRDLLGRVSRTLRLPPLAMRDLSGDGRPDLLLQDGKGIFQYIAGPEGLPLEPSAEVDLGRFEEKVPPPRFDAGNVAGLAKQGVWEHWADLDQDGADDLVVLAGGTVIIYLGGEAGLDLRRPRDQLPTAGNVLYAFTAKVDADDYPDLVLLRVEDVSLARMLTWIVFSFSVDFDLLAYEGLGNGRFRKRPMPQSKSLELKSPSLLDLFRGRDAADALRRTVARLADFDGDGRATDLVLLDPDGRLRGWRGLVEDPAVLERAGDRFLRDLLQREKVLDLDVDTLIGWLLGRASLLVQLAESRPPDFERPAPEGWELPQTLAVADFDGDGRDEVLVLRRRRPTEEGVERRRLEGYVHDPDAR